MTQKLSGLGAKVTALALFMMAFIPMLASAQTVGSILFKVSELLNTIIPILITLAVIYFIYGVIQYVTAKDEDKQAEARKVIVSGIIGIFVIVSIWGLVSLVARTFGIGSGLDPSLGIPCVPGTPGCN
ncbi:hypothetical protein COB64_02675 [Candidatus Wolfebacteria bacterium]|nr:MAG: hypothetical protein COB64_02675 [Candidatus Wolfebacteria bacterium]